MPAALAVLLALPLAALGQVLQADHLMLQVRKFRKTCDKSSGASPVFEPVDGGDGRACRGADSMDRGTVGEDYAVFTSIASLDECKARCLDTSSCRGVEYRTGRCEVWTRAEGIATSVGASGYTCLRLRRQSVPHSPFSPADGGAGRACRGADASDRGVAGTDFVFFAGAETIDECQAHCVATQGCQGVEFKPGHCEVWTRPEGIGATAQASGFTCLRYAGGVSAPTPTTTPMPGKSPFEPIDGGEDRACRGSGPGDKGEEGTDYTPMAAASLEGCMAHCVEMGALKCKGIEYYRGRCEVWTRREGISATVEKTGFTCLRYNPTPGPGHCGAFEPAQSGADVAGALIAAVHGESPEQCCVACTAASGCEGFAFVAEVQECYLKANVTGTFAKPGVVAQVLHMPVRDMPACDGYGAPQVDRDIFGDELDQAHAISAEYCCGACERHIGCQGFTYLPELQMCYFKANITGTYARPGRISQLKPAGTTPPPTVRPGSCEGYGTLMRDTEVGGVPLAHVAVATVDECCGACERASGCEGFAYLEEFKMCYLKAYVTGTYPKQGPLARLKLRASTTDPSTQPTCDAFQGMMVHTDLVGRLLGEVPASSPDQCCGACEEIAACDGFTYYAHTQACYLKAEVTAAYANPNRVSRVTKAFSSTTLAPTEAPKKEFCGNFGALEPNTDLVGAVIAEAGAPTAEHCCELCENTELCDGFAYLEDLGTCYLKAFVSGSYPKDGCIARVRPEVLRLQPAPAPLPEPKPEDCGHYEELTEEVDLVGATIAEEIAPSADHCCGLCDNAQHCEGFSYLEEFNMCYLKAFVQGTYAKEKCVARVKSGILRSPTPQPQPEPEPQPEPQPEPPLASCGRFEDVQAGLDLVGATIAEEAAPSADHCCGLCDSTEHCEGFSYLEAFHMCYLKGFVSGTYAKEGCVARARPGAARRPRDDSAVFCEGYGELLEDTDLSGVLLSAVHGETSNHCCRACAEAEGCQGFAFLEEFHQCYLKANVTGTHGKKDCVTRTRSTS